MKLLKKIIIFIKDKLIRKMFYKIFLIVRKIFFLSAKINIEKLGYDKLFDNRPNNAIPPDYLDLWYLYKIIKKRKPKMILEYGSGCSTVIIAQALKDNNNIDNKEKGFLLSIDADKFWAEEAKKIIPESLREFCKIIYSPLIESKYNDISVFFHKENANFTPDMIFLDGPELTKEIQAAADIVKFEDKLSKNFFLIVDGRDRQIKFLKSSLKRKYLFRKNRILRNSIFALKE